MFVSLHTIVGTYSHHTAYAVATDLVCTVLPIHVVWNVKIPLSTKAAVCGLMSLGLVYVVTSALDTIDANSFVKSHNLFSHPSSISRNHNRRSLLRLLHRRDLGEVRVKHLKPVSP